MYNSFGSVQRQANCVKGQDTGSSHQPRYYRFASANPGVDRSASTCTVLSDPNARGLFADQIHTYFEQGTLSDTQFKIGSRTLFAHRCKLCERSAYFCKLLLRAFAEKSQAVVGIDDDDSERVVATIRYIYGLEYSSKNDKNEDNLEQSLIMPHARMYIVPEKYGMLDQRGTVYRNIQLCSGARQLGAVSVTAHVDAAIRLV
nr:hypothetical protein B0A51_03497 [Rachicladosporium sp. CCFEE 5018]